MNNRQKEERLMTSYLLGEASELEQMLLEANYFCDSTCFELMLAMEDELIRNYVGGQMSPREQLHFKQHFLKSARHRERYKTLSELMGCVAQHPENKCLSPHKPYTSRPVLKKRRSHHTQPWL